MKILQFGAGNFLRAYWNLMLEQMNNELGTNFTTILAQSTPTGQVEEIAAAKKFHVLLRGYVNDEYKEELYPITNCTEAVNQYQDLDKFKHIANDPELCAVVSNTTEAGIYYEKNHIKPHNFPSFLAFAMNERANAKLSPLFIIPMELIEHNGKMLKEYIISYGKDFGYSQNFVDYVNSCYFYDTLVDRLVPGYPHDVAARLEKEIGQDKFLTSGEFFHLLVLEGSSDILNIFPFDKTDLNVILTADKLSFYRDRKVRLLNGAHTVSVPIALYHGIEEVDKFVSHEKFGPWLLDIMHKEIAFAMDDSKETHAYADEVVNRFKNPSLGHKFRSIALNSISKTNTRFRPTIIDYYKKTGEVPNGITASIRAMLKMYDCENGVQKDLPNGELVLKDFSELHGATKLEGKLKSIFQGLDDEIINKLISVINSHKAHS